MASNARGCVHAAGDRGLIPRRVRFSKLLVVGCRLLARTILTANNQQLSTQLCFLRRRLTLIGNGQKLIKRGGHSRRLGHGRFDIERKPRLFRRFECI